MCGKDEVKTGRVKYKMGRFARIHRKYCRVPLFLRKDSSRCHIVYPEERRPLEKY